MIVMILITALDLMDENFFEILMVIMFFEGLLGLLVSIFSSFETHKERIVVIIVSILFIVFGSIYSNFIMFRSLNYFYSYL